MGEKNKIITFRVSSTDYNKLLELARQRDENISRMIRKSLKNLTGD